MSKFLPNSFQITNNIADEVMCLISGNALKCYLLIIRKTRGWQKEKDSISISQFKKYTGIKRIETISKSLDELIHFGLITNIKTRGKITNYKPKEYNGKTVPVLKNSSTKKPYHPVLKNRTTSSTKKPYPTKDTVKTTIHKTNKSKPKKEIQYPDNLNLEAWELWKQHKKEKKQTYKPSGEKTAIKKLCVLSHANQMLCIENSVSNNYTGFFTEKFTGVQNGTNQSNYRKESNFERNERIVKELLTS